MQSIPTKFVSQEASLHPAVAAYNKRKVRRLIATIEHLTCDIEDAYAEIDSLGGDHVTKPDLGA